MTFAQPFTDYEILDRVGAGAMGTVFKARHKKLSRIVALKVLKPSLARDGRYVDRLRREARIVASLNHPNIVTGYDLGEEGGYHFFVMEFVEGKSLRALLAEWGMFAEEYVIDTGIQIAEALDHAYQRGVIHRDVKPGNVLIDEDGDVKLTDMGLAKGPADLTLTRDGATVGTPQYISPEQARNPQDVDVRTDLYSLGATLYHMATGVPPFTGETMAELIGKVIYDPPVPPNAINPALSEGCSLVLRKLLAKDLRVRYQTPRELLDDLGRVKKAQPPQVDTARLAAGEGERRSRLPQRLMLAVVVMAVIVLAVWFGSRLQGAGETTATSDTFLQELDLDLAGMSTPGERWLRLRTLTQAAPPGMGHELQRRENREFRNLTAAVDAAVAAFTGAGWATFREWVSDPAEWPDREDCERQHLVPTLRAATGLEPSQLPATLEPRLAELRQAVDLLLERRAEAMLHRLDEFLVTTLPDLAARRLWLGDFAGAEKLWLSALSSFCRQFGEPRLDRLAESTRRAASARCERALQAARPSIEAAEALRADELKKEVTEVVGHFEERLAAGRAPELVARALDGYRQELLQLWPASASFHPARDPWREAERLLEGAQQRIRLAVEVAARERFQRRCDLAWRALCHGEVHDALAVLADLQAPTAELAVELDQHRRALHSAGLVHDRLLGALVEADIAVPAFPRQGSGLAVTVHAEPSPGGPALFCRTGDEQRRAALTEFRFRDLLDKVRKVIGSNPLASLPAADRRRGTIVLQLVGDELAGLAELLAGVEDAFLVDEVAPRIQRVRGEAHEVVLGRTELYACVADELQRAREGGDPGVLERAIQSFEVSVAPTERSPAERKVLGAAKAWSRLARRSELVREAIREEGGEGIAIAVAIDEERDEITADLVASAPQLLADATAGWELRDDVLEFAGGDRPWQEIEQSRLLMRTGMPVGGESRLELDLVFPEVTVGRRFYIVEFRGIAVMLVLSADDFVHAALVEGDLRNRANADRAFDRALAGLLEKAEAKCVPGGVHRLSIAVHPTRSGRFAEVKVALERSELLEARPRLDPEAPVALALYPRQELRVRRLAVKWRGN